MGFAGKPLIFGRNPRLADVSRLKVPILHAAIFHYVYTYNNMPSYICILYERSAEYAYIITTYTHTHTRIYMWVSTQSSGGPSPPRIMYFLSHKLFVPKTG